LISDEDMETWKLFLKEEKILQESTLLKTDLVSLKEVILAWKKAFVSSFGNQGFSLKYPMFEVETHWPYLINYLSPVQYMNGKLNESSLGEARRLGAAGNQKNIDSFILQKIRKVL